MIPSMNSVPATLRGVQRRIERLLPKLDVVLTELTYIHPERRDALLRAFGPLEPLIRQYLDWNAERKTLIPPPVQSPMKIVLPTAGPKPPPKPRRAA